MQKPKTIKELLDSAGGRVGQLRTRAEGRRQVLDHVTATLPPELADTVVSAGIDAGQLTLGVAGAAWAARLRYVTDTVRMRVSASMGVSIDSVRIRVMPPRDASPRERDGR